MSEQDPLRQSRLGLRGVLLVSGGVLVASSVFLLPGVGLLQGSSVTTDLSLVPTASGPEQGGQGEEDTAARNSVAAPSAGVEVLLPVYWLGDVNGSARLFREFLVSPGPASLDPIAESVRLMTVGDPLDPDYRSPWREASSVSSSISTKNVITLDISSDAVAETLPEAEAQLAVQQLVHTATAAAANAGLIAGGEASSVVVLVDGAAGHRAFGTVDLDGEWTRDPSALSPVWIIDPQQDVEAAGRLAVHGLAAGDGDVRWRIDRLPEQSDGSTDDAGYSDPTGGSTSSFRNGSADVEAGDAAAGTYSFSLGLPPGRYEITVSVTVGNSEAEDTKTVVVR